MNAILQSPQARFEPLTLPHLDAVLQVEQAAYPHPWTERNFLDSLQAGYAAQLLVAASREKPELLGYFVAMKGVDEVHLLNLAVAPACQRQGWARVMLDALAIWARGQRAESLWLEVRAGNLRAMQVYQSQGFSAVGKRKNYYPSGHGQREDAVVMSLRL
mgnify:CR=1 FL=1